MMLTIQINVGELFRLIEVESKTNFCDICKKNIVKEQLTTDIYNQQNT